MTGMKSKYADPQTINTPFIHLGNLNFQQFEKWDSCHFHIRSIFWEHKQPFDLSFLPIIQSVNMQAPDQLCKKDIEEKKENEKAKNKTRN